MSIKCNHARFLCILLSLALKKHCKDLKYSSVNLPGSWLKVQILGSSSSSLNRCLQGRRLGLPRDSASEYGNHWITWDMLVWHWAVLPRCIFNNTTVSCWYSSQVYVSDLPNRLFITRPYFVHVSPGLSICWKVLYRNVEGIAGILLVTKSLRSTGPKRRSSLYILSILCLRPWCLPSGLWLVPQWSRAFGSLGFSGCPQSSPSGDFSTGCNGCW